MSIQEQLSKLQAELRATQFTLIILIILLLGSKAFGSDAHIAKADFQSVPLSIGQYYQYFTTAYVDPEERKQLEIAFKFTVPSLSRTVLLDATVPQRLSPTLWRINLKYLQWGPEFIDAIRTDYPYSTVPGRRPLLVRADWFLQYIWDATKSGELYHQLIFGKEIKTEKEMLDFFETNLNSQFAYSFIEDDSGVALNKTRVLHFAPTAQGSPITYTRDFKDLNDRTDPLENLDKEPPHDASELIAALPKRLGQTGEVGLLQAYSIFDRKGSTVRSAPPDIVVDYAGARGPELRNGISCVACHDRGLLSPSVNALRRFNESGGLFGSHDPKAAIRINERFNISPQRQVDYWNESYRLAVEYCTGAKPEESSKAVQSCIKQYDQDVTFAQAAKELHLTPKGLGRLIIGLSQKVETNGKPYLPARVVMLAKIPIRRELWEVYWRQLYFAKKGVYR